MRKPEQTTYTVSAVNSEGDTLELTGLSESEMRELVERLQDAGITPTVTPETR